MTQTNTKPAGLRFRFLIAFLVLFSSLPSLRADEFRGVWVDAWGAGFLNASQVTTLVDHCRTYNFNAVIVQMRRRGDAFYMPQAPNGDPRTIGLAANYDALQELLDQCHNGTPRIEVHCWVPTHLIWADHKSAPSQPGHVYNLHPEYLMKNAAGATQIGEGFYLDPGHPGAAQWNYNMAMDVCRRYDVDGFHWDYVRYPQQDSGFNETAIARYNAEFGLSGNPSPSDAQFSDWRRRQVTDFLRWTSSDLLALKPNLVISASVFGSRSDAFNARFQDWAAWNKEGLLDLAMPMIYSPNNSVYNTRTDDSFVNQGIRRIYPGPGAYMNTKENTVAQLSYARNKGFLGTAFYSYRTSNSGPVDQTATFTHVRDNYQPTWTSVPSLPWKTNPTTGTLKGTVTRADTGAAVYNATVTLNSTPVRTQKSEAHGKYAFFETAPGTYSVTVTATGLGTAKGNVTITKGATATLDLVLSATDTTAPIVSNVGAGSVTDLSATITWNTDEASASAVEYGSTTSYGATTAETNTVMNHTIQLNGLKPGTVYHYRVRSNDASNNKSVSGDSTFTTLAPGAVAEIIIDNPSATIAGAWFVGSGSTDKFGADYKFRGKGNGEAYFQYTPNIVTKGDYQVYEWHAAGPNRTPVAPHVIAHNGGTETVTVDQQTRGGRWNLLGTFNFQPGATQYVRITDAFPAAGQTVIADAIKFVHVKSPAPAAPVNPPPTAVSVSKPAAVIVPSPTQMHVQSITMTWVTWANKHKARAVINVVNGANIPVKEATVTGNFTGEFTNRSLTGVSNRSGSAGIRSFSSMKNGSLTFTVTDITAPGLSYNSKANVATSATISR